MSGRARHSQYVHTDQGYGVSALGGVIISETAQQQKKDWVNIAFLSLTPIIGIIGTAAWTWTHTWHQLILIGAGFGVPTLIGAAFGDPIAGLLGGGFLRIVVIHHTTFFVNSLAHSLGKPLFNAEVSARDNWFVAMLTLGEGYHSFHHRFPTDFRNGIRWYQWDPSKWLIRGFKAVGLASDLRTAPLPQIEQARMQAALKVVK